MLGRAVTARLVAECLPVRALSRGSRPSTAAIEWISGDIATGAGLAEATAGVSAIIHLASAPYRREYTRTVEIAGTQRLLVAAREAGSEQINYTSIMRCARIPWGYFRTKLEAERVVRESAVASSIIRLGQFFDFVDQAFTGLARTGLILSDRAIVAQPVDTADVAGRIVEILQRGPRDEPTEFGGPQQLGLREAADQWVRATGRRRLHVPVRVPGKLGAAFRAHHLTTRAEPRGTRTWQEYLADKYSAYAKS